MYVCIGMYADKQILQLLNHSVFLTKKNSLLQALHPRPHSPVHENEDPSALLHLVRLSEQPGSPGCIW